MGIVRYGSPSYASSSLMLIKLSKCSQAHQAKASSSLMLIKLSKSDLKT